MPAQDLLTGQRIVAPEPKTTDLESSAKEESETTVESGLDKVELPPVPTTEQPAESKPKPAKKEMSPKKRKKILLNKHPPRRQKTPSLNQVRTLPPHLLFLNRPSDRARSC